MDNILNNIKNTTKREKIYLICFLVAILSLFLPWIGIWGVNRNGFSEQGYLFLILMLYPVICILLNKKRIRIINRLASVLNLVFIIGALSQASVSILGQQVDLLQYGAVIMLLAILVILFTAFFDGILKKKQINPS